MGKTNFNNKRKKSIEIDEKKENVLIEEKPTVLDGNIKKKKKND